MQPMSTGRRVGAFLAVAIVSIIVAAGGILVWPHVTGPDETPNAVLTIQAQVSGSELRIQGTTDLPDGTLLRVSLSDVRVESYQTIEMIAHVSASRYEPGSTCRLAERRSHRHDGLRPRLPQSAGGSRQPSWLSRRAADRTSCRP